MKVLAFSSDPSRDECLGAIDALRADVVSGKIIAFSAAGITPSDEVLSYTGSSRPVTWLRMQGAISQLLFSVLGNAHD